MQRIHLSIDLNVLQKELKALYSQVSQCEIRKAEIPKAL